MNALKYPLGYTKDSSVDPKYSKYVKWLFEKWSEYQDNPPEALVQSVSHERALETGKPVSDEEAKKLVTTKQVEEYLAKEFDNMLRQELTEEEYCSVISELNRGKMIPHSRDNSLEPADALKETSIISPEVFKQAQKKMRTKRECSR